MTITIYLWTPTRCSITIHPEYLDFKKKHLKEHGGADVEDSFAVVNTVNDLALNADPRTILPLPANFYLAEEISTLLLHCDALFMETPAWDEYSEARLIVNAAEVGGIPVFKAHHHHRRLIEDMGAIKARTLIWQLHNPDVKFHHSQFMTTTDACRQIWNLSE